jgi:pSer/pThr/pTyr-binding forkhead associated (FHA) protein
MQGQLIPLGGGVPILLTKERILVGRAPVSDVRLNDGSVSSRHCLLSFDGQMWVLEDLDSKNGTTVNAMRVTHANLKPGDTIVFARTTGYRIEYRPGSGPGQPDHDEDDEVDEILSIYRDRLDYTGSPTRFHQHHLRRSA